RAERRVERTPGRVFERVARLEHGLLAHDARSADLFDLARAVADDPVAREQLAGALALVAQPDRVEEEPLAVSGVGVLCRITRLDLHAQPLGDGLGARHVVHRVSSTATPTHSQLRLQSQLTTSPSRAALVASRSRQSAK